MVEAWLAGTFGLLLGSFLNVAIFRLPRDMSVAWPRRSFCGSCNTPVAAYDNLPVLSWLLLRGRCRRCRAPIPWRYPLVELLTALALFFAVAQLGWTIAAARVAVFSCLLLVLLFTDLETFLLPDEITLGGTVVGWVFAMAAPWPAGLVALLLPQERLPAGESLADSVIGGLFPAAVLWSIGALYARVRHREGLGFGDVKMLLLLGAFLGLEGALLTMIVASVTGALFGLALVVFRGKDAALTELPFGTFLALAGLAVAHGGKWLAAWLP